MVRPVAAFLFVLPYLQYITLMPLLIDSASVPCRNYGSKQGVWWDCGVAGCGNRRALVRPEQLASRAITSGTKPFFS
ncbi:hypothetical protein F5Y09DRAFT_308906 [Xylaria sp. FL1042]|nr:hypothetical protein F5Y09DRAFT_308906 [Xylaria sp. FL1042]